MRTIGTFFAGFVSGWLTRSTIDSSRGLAVGAISAFYTALDRTQRLVAIEREYFDDLLAEARLRYEQARPSKPGRGQRTVRDGHEHSA